MKSFVNSAKHIVMLTHLA